jgi:hypothetical protein
MKARVVAGRAAKTAAAATSSIALMIRVDECMYYLLPRCHRSPSGWLLRPMDGGQGRHTFSARVTVLRGSPAHQVLAAVSAAPIRVGA